MVEFIMQIEGCFDAVCSILHIDLQFIVFLFPKISHLVNGCIRGNSGVRSIHWNIIFSLRGVLSILLHLFDDLEILVIEFFLGNWNFLLFFKLAWILLNVFQNINHFLRLLSFSLGACSFYFSLWILLVIYTNSIPCWHWNTSSLWRHILLGP